MELGSSDHFSTLTPEFQTVHAHAASADVVYTDWAVSRDGGQTWEERDIADSLRIRIWDRVVSHPADPAVIYSCGESGVRKWGGYLATRATLATASAYGPCRDLFVFPNHPDRMWMGTDTGLWETLDAGQSWSRQNRGLPNVPITRINPSHDWEEILVSAFGRGLFVLDASEVGGIRPPDPVGVMPAADVPAEMPALLPNYPNPFSGSTIVHFTTPHEASVRLDVFNVLGRRMQTVADKRFRRGAHQVVWNSEGLARGVYFLRMDVDGHATAVRKMVRR